MAVAALAGYLAVWGGTAAGQGWRLAPHLALAHAQAPPPLVAETLRPTTLTTLRSGTEAPAGTNHDRAHGSPMHGGHADGGHADGGHAHASAHTRGTPHGHGGGHGAAPGGGGGRPLAARAEPPPAADAAADAAASDRHRHGDVVHSHAPPPPRDGAPVVSLDKHRLPAGAHVPPPASVDAAPTGGLDGSPALVDLSVETPPPIARG